MEDVVHSPHLGVDGAKAQRIANGREPWTQLNKNAQTKEDFAISIRMRISDRS